MIEDRYLPLRALATYSGLSLRKLRDWLTDPLHPLPHYHVGGKILIRQSEFDTWILGFKAERDDRGAAIIDEFLRAV